MVAVVQIIYLLVIKHYWKDNPMPLWDHLQDLNVLFQKIGSPDMYLSNAQ